MQVKVKDLQKFENCVFGSAHFLKYWPQLLNSGVEVLEQDQVFYIMQNGRMASDSAFFTQEDMQYLEVIEINHDDKMPKRKLV